MPSLLRGGEIAATAMSVLAIAACGGGGGQAGKSGTSPTSPPSGSTPSAATGPTGQQGIALSSPEAHAALVSAINRSPNIPPGQDDRIATCAIQKLQAQHYATVNEVPGPVATQVGRRCAEEALGGIDSPVAHQVLVDRIGKIPGVNPGQANQITDCVIARFRTLRFTSIATVPQSVATRAGQDCARRVVGH